MDITVTYKNGVVEMYPNAKEVKDKNNDKFLTFSTESKEKFGLIIKEFHNINLDEIVGYKITYRIDAYGKIWYN